MRCHYIYHKGEKVLIPGCMKAAVYGFESTSECTCKPDTWASFEKKAFNDQVEKMKKEISERDSLIENLQQEIERLKSKTGPDGR